MSTENDFCQRYGPWAVVAGASSGIGAEFARLLAEAGLHLILIARRSERLESMADELRAECGVEVSILELDLGRSDFLAAIRAACGDREVGLLVYNAGRPAKGPLCEADPDELEGVLNVNCRAPLLFAREFVPDLIRRGGGGLLLVGSIEGFQGFPYSGVYSASKAFLLSMGESLWAEVRGVGVDVLVLLPGATDTELLAKSGVDREDMVTGVMGPAAVARIGLDQLGKGRPSVIAGNVNRLMIGAMSMLPRRLRVLAGGKGIRDALDKHRDRNKG